MPGVEIEAIERALATLRDVEAVGGSFLVDPHGALWAQDMPAYFDSMTLGQAGPIMARLLACWEQDQARGECTLRFSETYLFVARCEAGILGVLLLHASPVSTLRTATGLVGRRVARILCGQEQLQASVPPRSPEAVQADVGCSANAPGPVSRKRGWYWRGQRFES